MNFTKHIHFIHKVQKIISETSKHLHMHISHYGDKRSFPRHDYKHYTAIVN
jgi:hypothetical protein